MSAISSRLKNKGGGNDSSNSVIYCHIHDAGFYIMITYLMFFFIGTISIFFIQKEIVFVQMSENKMNKKSIEF